MKVEKTIFWSDHSVKVLWILVFGIFWRLIPHVPNMTPFVALGLFAGAFLPRGLPFLLILGALFISDCGLSFIFGYPIISYYTFFTYTGFLGIVLVGSSLISGSKWRFPLYFVGSSLWFWVWTNFGVWVWGIFYPKTFAGLGACYYMALPFLRNALIGDVISGIIIFGLYMWFFENKTREWRNW